MATYVILQVKSSDPADWGTNEVLDQFQAPSPLTAAEGEATPEATPGS